MAYKHTFNRDYNYLAHFNKNHDPKNGRFTYGDGDGDGIINDHGSRSQNKKIKFYADNKEWHEWNDEKYRKNLMKADEKRRQYDEEFENNEANKKLKMEMKKALEEANKMYDKYWDNIEDFDDNGEPIYKDKKLADNYYKMDKKASDMELEYYSKKGEYVCKKLLTVMDEKDVAKYGIGWDLPIKYDGKTDDLIKNYSEQYVWSFSDWD